MTKRNTRSESASTPASTRPKRAGATHSRKSPAPAAISEPVPVDQESVARLAYALWEARGGVGGSPEEDWLRAERELVNR